MIGNILNTLHSFLHGLHNGKNCIFLTCTIKKLYFIKVENLVAIKVFNLLHGLYNTNKYLRCNNNN